MKTILSTCILSVALCAFSQAQTISINLAEDDAGVARANQTLLPEDVAGAAGFEAANWNNALFTTGSLADLMDDSGATTSASVSWGDGGAWGDGTANTDADDGIPNAKLQRGYVDDNGTGSTVTVNVTGIPYADYGLVVYLSSDNPGPNGVLHGDISINGATGVFGGDAIHWEDQPSIDIGRNALVFDGLSGPDLEIVGTRISGQSRASISGFQIGVGVPEPSSLGAMLASALLGIFWFRRR